MDFSQPAQPAPRPYSAAPVRPRNGLGVAALVIGVASLVAGVSFVLFPLALVGGLVGLILGIIALTRGKNRGATNTGQAIAGVVCCALALVISIDLSVRWARGLPATRTCSPGSTSASPRPPTGRKSPPASPASPTRSGPSPRPLLRALRWARSADKAFLNLAVEVSFRARGSTEPGPCSVTLVTDRLDGAFVAKLQ